MANDNDMERRGAQALLATFLQMTRHAELARELQRARLRATERRMRAAAEPEEVARLRQQLDAQEGQGAVIEEAVQRFHRRAPQLARFAEAGLTYEDYEQLGLQKVVTKQAVDEARRRGADARDRSPEGRDGTSDEEKK